MADIEMEDNLFPEDIDDIDEDILVDEEETFTGYKEGPYFDTEQGDLVLNGAGQVLIGNKIDVWTVWCEKTIATHRYKCDLYSTDVGIDYDAVWAAEDREEAETILESEIMDALIVDPYGRTQYVQSVEIDWISADSIKVKVTVVGMENEVITVETIINR